MTNSFNTKFYFLHTNMYLQNSGGASVADGDPVPAPQGGDDGNGGPPPAVPAGNGGNGAPPPPVVPAENGGNGGPPPAVPAENGGGDIHGVTAQRGDALWAACDSAFAHGNL